MSEEYSKDDLNDLSDIKESVSQVDDIKNKLDAVLDKEKVVQKHSQSISLDMYQANKVRKKFKGQVMKVSSYNRHICHEILCRYAETELPTFSRFYTKNKQDYWPSKDAFLKWMASDYDGLGTLKLQLDAIKYSKYVDEIVDIADDDGDDYLKIEGTSKLRLDHNGNPIKNAAKLERDKLKIDTRFKVMKAMIPDIAQKLENHKPDTKAEAIVDKLADAISRIAERQNEREINIDLGDK